MTRRSYRKNDAALASGSTLAVCLCCNDAMSLRDALWRRPCWHWTLLCCMLRALVDGLRLQGVSSIVIRHSRLRAGWMLHVRLLLIKILRLCCRLDSFLSGRRLLRFEGSDTIWLLALACRSLALSRDRGAD